MLDKASRAGAGLAVHPAGGGGVAGEGAHSGRGDSLTGFGFDGAILVARIAVLPVRRFDCSYTYQLQGIPRH